MCKRWGEGGGEKVAGSGGWKVMQGRNAWQISCE